MATTDKNTIYSWFQTDDFPTEEQFRATWDSFWHKSESIPMSSISGLSQAFVNTATTSQVNAKANIDASNINGEIWRKKIGTATDANLVHSIGDEKIDGKKSFVKPIIIQGHQYYNNSEKKTALLGVNAEYTLDPIVTESIISGFNVLPKLKPVVDPLTETWLYGAGYMVYGVDILKDFTGDSNYRPGHNAHDTWVAMGRGIAGGVIDGTNGTLFGTHLFPDNIVKYWDSVTLFGKGLKAGIKVGDHVPSADVPFYPLSTPNFNMRSMMDGVTIMGSENWLGDVHSFTAIGSQTKTFKYAFNSIVLGFENQNYPHPSITDEQLNNNCLDNDIIIGNGLWKNPNRYPKTHNLLIGSTNGYGNGGWDASYIPLIEGNFKEKYLHLNGKLRVNDEMSVYAPSKIYNQSEYISLPLSLLSMPAEAEGKVTIDAQGNVTLTNAPAGRYVLASNIPDGYYYFTMLNTGISRTYNIRVLSYVYDSATIGYPYSDKHCYADSTTSREMAFELTGETTGVLQCALKTIDGTTKIKPIEQIFDYEKNLTYELRVGKSNQNYLSIGKNSMTLHAYGNNAINLGNNNLQNSGLTRDVVCIGSNNFALAGVSERTNVIGHNIGNKLKGTNRLNVFGANSLTNAVNISWSTLIGNANS